MFLHRVSSTPDADAFYYPDEDDRWQTLRWQDVGDQVRDIAGGLASLGIEKGDRVSILSNTRVDWILADLGVLCATGATTTIYPSNTAEECEYIIADSGSRFVIAEDDSQVEKLLEVREQLGDVVKVITFDGRPGHDDWVITLRHHLHHNTILAVHHIVGCVVDRPEHKPCRASNVTVARHVIARQ